jgi:hypothetical protein
MTKLPLDHPFRKHAQNLAALKKGLIQAERLHKDSIRHGDQEAVSFAARMHMFTLGLLAEARLRVLLWDPDGFNEREREIIMRLRSQGEQWKAAVEYSFRRHYAIPIHLSLDELTLGTLGSHQIESIIDLLDGELATLIQDRNRTAHAQWRWHLNYKETTLTGPAPTPLDYLAIHRRGQLIECVGTIIHVLVVSEPTFQRDFGDTFGKIDALRLQLAGRYGESYSDYASRLRRSPGARALRQGTGYQRLSHGSFHG